MKSLRGVIKLLVLFTGMLLIFGVYVACQLVMRPFAGARQRCHDAVVRAWARYCSFILGMRVIVEGEPPVPPFFMVANHLSYVDVIALLTCVRATFLAKSEIARWPLLGMLARGVGTLFIDRKRKRDLVRVSELLHRELASGRGLVVFPEGTSWNSDAILPFKPSTLEVAVGLGMPVHCAALHYITPMDCESARTAVCWWGDAKFAPHMKRLAALPEFIVRIRFGTQPVSAGDRKTLAEAAHRAVAALHLEIKNENR